jgi:hypothetical protein
MKRHIVITLSLLATFVTLPSFAQPAAQRNDVSVWLVRPFVHGSTAIEEDAVVRLRPVSSLGFGYRRAVDDRWSISADAMFFGADATVEEGGERLADLDTLAVGPFAVSGQYHFCRTCRVSPWVGGGAAWVVIGDLKSDDLRAAGIDHIDFGTRFAPLVSAGADVPLSQRFSVAVDARYMPLKVSGRVAGDPEETKVTVNPLLVSAGLRFRF